MALDKTYTGNGSTTTFDITFPYLEQEDINVAVKPSGGSYATKVLGTDYSISNMQVVFGSAPANNSTVRIRRSTKITSPRHVHYAGSSLTAGSLNDNNRQLLYAMEERGLTGDDTGTVEFDTGDKGDIYIHSSTNVTLNDNVVDGNALADNSVGTSHYVDDSIEHVHLKNDCIDGDNIQNNAINSEHYANDSINAAHYAPGSVDSTAIGNDQVNSQHYAAASIDNEHLADDAVGIDELSASGTASSSTFLRGDNSWASLAANIGLVKQVIQASTTTEVDMDNTMTDSGLTANITTTGSHKVLVIVQQAYKIVDSDGGFAFEMKLFKGSTELLHRSMNHDASSSANNEQDFHTLIHLDTPGSAGTYTYKMQMKGGGNDAKAQPGSQRSDIFLIELAI